MSVPDNTNLQLIPLFNDMKYVQETGYLTPEALIYNDFINQYLQNNLSGNGFVTPGLRDDQIAKVAPKMPSGTFWFDTVNEVIVFKIGITLYKVDLLPYP